MKHSEKIIRNLKTGQEIRFLRTSRDTQGQLLEMESTYSPRGTRPPAHFHPQQAEVFTVLTGELTVQIGNRMKILCAGDQHYIPPRAVHTMWNASQTHTVVNWQVRPALDTQALLEMAFGLANASTSRSGAPSLLQTALLMRRFSSEFRLATPGPLVQKLLFGFLASVARLAGHSITPIPQQ